MTLRLVCCKVLILTLCQRAAAQSSLEIRLRALAEVETCTKDRAIGRAGEVSRYQISPQVWIQYSHLPLAAAENPFTAKAVVVKIMSERTGSRSVTDAEWYLIYHRPAGELSAPGGTRAGGKICRRVRTALTGADLRRHQCAIQAAESGLNQYVFATAHAIFAFSIVYGGHDNGAEAPEIARLGRPDQQPLELIRVHACNMHIFSGLSNHRILIR